MPVILQHIHSGTELDFADSRDLELLRADHPAPGPDRDQRFAAGQWLVAGRFNDRILAAAWLTDSDSRWRIEDLAVRAMTRRRGVARQLLILLIRDAAQAQRGIAIAGNEVAILEPLLLELGFARTDSAEHEPAWFLSSPSPSPSP